MAAGTQVTQAAGAQQDTARPRKAPSRFCAKVRYQLLNVFAGTLLTFIPAIGDYINAYLLGSTQTTMIGNVIQSKFLTFNDYPSAAALSFTLMAGMMVFVIIYARILGTEDLA